MSSPGPSLNDFALLVEGNDDVQVIKRIAEISSIHLPPIHETEGIDRLLTQIYPQINVSGRRALGIVVDANDAPSARWQAISDRLVRSGIAPPQYPAMEGTIIPAQSGMPRVGVWLWPDNESSGELEDFIKSLIPEDDPVWPLSEEYIDRILAQQLNEFNIGKKSRAQVHAWLSVRRRPRRMGQAIGARDLNANAPTFATFTNWLTSLFPPD